MRILHPGCCGYSRDTSPNLDRISAEGVRFDNSAPSDAPRPPSRSALVTGMFGIHHGIINHDGFNADFRPKRNTVCIGGFDERLEATGRGWAVPPLKERHPEEFR